MHGSITSLPSSQDVIILGDFNCPDINWSTLNANTTFSTALCNHLYTLNYFQLVTEPTHRQGNTLDLILTNAPHRIQNVLVHRPGRILVSDHHVVTADVSSTGPSTAPPTYITPPLNYARADLKGLASYVANAFDNSQSTRSSPVSLNADLNVQWNFFKQGIFSACEKFVPRTRIPRKCTPRWYNPCIRHQLNQVRTLKRRIRLHPTPYSKNKLENLESSLCLLMDKAKEDFLQSIVTTFKSEPKKLYGYLSSLSNSKSSPRVQGTLQW